MTQCVSMYFDHKLALFTSGQIPIWNGPRRKEDEKYAGDSKGKEPLTSSRGTSCILYKFNR